MYKRFTEPIELADGLPNILIIENKDLRRSFIEEIYKQLETGEGEIILSRDADIIKLEKVTEIVINPFSLDLNQKKILNKISSMLREEAIDSANYHRSMELLGIVTSYMEDLAASMTYPVKIKEVELTDIIKIASPRVDIELTDFFEDLINYMGLLTDVLGISLLVTVNMALFLSEAEIKEFFKMANYKGIKVLLIESSDLIERDLMQRLTIIDKDQCLIKNY